MITSEQGVGARDIDVNGAHLLFADKVAGIGRHARTIGVGEAAAGVINLTFSVAGAMGVGCFEAPVIDQLLVEGGEGGFVLHRP